MNQIKTLLQKIKESDVAKNILTLASGNVIGYAVTLVALPFVSRVYTMSELGGYDLMVSSAVILITTLQMALILVIMIPEEDHQANCICKIIATVSLFGAVIIALALALVYPRFALFDIGVSYYAAIMMFALYICSFNVQSIYYSYVNRKKLYRVLFWNPILLAGANALISIGLGIVGFGTLGYMAGTIASYFVAILHMRRFVKPFEGKHSFGDYKDILKEYKAYPLVQMPANLIQVFGNQLPAQLLGRLFSTAALGGYTMATKILSVPVSLLATPINKVYYREVVERLGDNNDPGGFAYSLLCKNIKIAILPIGVLMVFGTEIAGFVLGEQWEVSGLYMLILGIAFLLHYCTACMSGTYIAARKQSYSFFIAGFTLVLYAVCFSLAAYLQFDVTQTIILYAVFSSIKELTSLSLCMRCLRFSLKTLWTFLLKYVLLAGVAIYIIYAVVHPSLFGFSF